MNTVSKEEFEQFFENKEFFKKQGNMFHSTVFFINNEEVGYIETNSYNTDIIYKLKYGTVNYNTIKFIGNLIKSKY